MFTEMEEKGILEKSNTVNETEQRLSNFSVYWNHAGE